MGIEDLEYWKNRIALSRNRLVAEHSRILQGEPETITEDIDKSVVLNKLVRKMGRLKDFYKRVVK